MNAHSSKDMEVYGNLMVQAAKIKQLDKPDPQKRKGSCIRKDIALSLPYFRCMPIRAYSAL